MEVGVNAAGWQHRVLHTTPEVASCINDLLATLRPFDWPDRDLFGIRLALEEALVNAIKHGHRSDPTKTVRIRFQPTPTQLIIEIEDEGAGFDPESVPDPLAPNNLERPGGRGVFLIRHYMTWVSYNERGNCITMCRRRSE